MADTTRDALLAALSEILYVDESDLMAGDATDLRDLGLDSVRFVLMMKHLGVDRESDVAARLSQDLSIACWVRELQRHS